LDDHGQPSNAGCRPTVAITQIEMTLLDHLLPDKAEPLAPRAGTLSGCLLKLQSSRLHARAHDPPPGNTVMWRGLSRLADIRIGLTIGGELVGD
jgi:hypothetical protein